MLMLLQGLSGRTTEFLRCHQAAALKSILYEGGAQSYRFQSQVLIHAAAPALGPIGFASGHF